MKLRMLFIATSLALCSLAWAGPGDATHKPMQGGVVATVKDIDYELVANATALQLYVRDHGKAVDVTNATAQMTLLSGTEKQEVQLKPNGNRLEVIGTFTVSHGTKAVAVITSGGKQSTARFVIK
jgi:hypothetical protein